MSNNLLERIMDKIESMDLRLNDIDKTLVRNTDSLEVHIVRTEQNEEQIEILKKELNQIKTRHTMIQGFFKYTGYIFTGVAAMAGFYKLLVELKSLL